VQRPGNHKAVSKYIWAERWVLDGESSKAFKKGEN
jgi:hypothetical protein